MMPVITSPASALNRLLRSSSRCSPKDIEVPSNRSSWVCLGMMTLLGSETAGGPSAGMREAGAAETHAQTKLQRSECGGGEGPQEGGQRSQKARTKRTGGNCPDRAGGRK